MPSILKFGGLFSVAVFGAALLGFANPSIAQVNGTQKLDDQKPTAQKTLPSAPSIAYQPITGVGRLKWFVDSTVGPETLAVGVFSAGIGTARDAPPEYRGTWSGFAKRYGMRLTGVSTGNAMEAGLGAIWHEDPRYFPARELRFNGRVRNVVFMTFLSHNREGNVMPAYARYISTPGNNFLSNTWRADSEANTRDALYRTVWGFVGLMGKNAFTEFWPSVKKHMSSRQQGMVPF